MKPIIFAVLLFAVYSGSLRASELVVRLHPCPQVSFNFSETGQEDPFADPFSNEGWHISPRVRGALTKYSEDVYDIRKYLANAGIVTEKALQLYDLELLAVVATPEMQEEAAKYIETIRWGRAMILEFTVSLSLEAEPALVKAVFPARSGQRLTLETVGSKSATMALNFDPTVGPSGRVLDLNFAVSANIDSNAYALSSTTTLALGKPQKIVLGQVGDPAKNLVLSVAAEYKPLIPKPLVDEETKVEIIEKVKALSQSSQGQ